MVFGSDFTISDNCSCIIMFVVFYFWVTDNNCDAINIAQFVERLRDSLKDADISYDR